MKSACHAPLLLLLVLASPPAPAQTPDLPPPTPEHTTQDVPGLYRRSDQLPTLRSEARIVSLDVIVINKDGSTVQNLQPSDFTVLENGAPQQITGFEAHTRPGTDNAARLLAAAKLPPNTFSDLPSPIPESSSIVFLLDALDSGLQNQMFLRQQMIGFMKSVPPGTRIAILQLDTRLHLIQGFTSNPDELLQAVQGKRDSVELLPGDTLAAVSMPGEPGFMANSGGVAGQIATVHQRAEIMRQALAQLVGFLAGVTGRKSVVWFYGNGAPGVAAHDELQRLALAGDQTRFVDLMGKTTASLALNQISLYMVDTSPPTFASITDNEMRDFLRKQGGDLYHTNDVKGEMQQIADRAWNFYTLSYTPTDRNFNGEFRRLNITLNARPELQAQYRDGYFARRDSGQLPRLASGPAGRSAAPASQTDALVDSAVRIGAIAPHDILFLAHVEPAPLLDKASHNTPLPKDNFLDPKYRNGKYREYNIHYTVQAATLDFLNQHGYARPGHLDFISILYGPGGEVVNSMVTHTSVHPTRDNVRDLLTNGLQMTQLIAVPAKGNFFLRIGIHDPDSNKMGVLEVPVDQIKLTAAN